MRFASLLLVALAACAIPVASREQLSLPACGDGVLDPGEVCDDGNTNDGDGCSATCASDERCGNQIVDANELCDDGNARGGDGCSSDCKSDERCGNSITDLSAGETCDDGNATPMDGCSANCQSNEQCGNNIVDSERGEECDSGMVASATCDLNCTFAVCGDGTRNGAAGEECDDANTTSGDGCDRFCLIEDCGNMRQEDNEQCDDGNTITTDDCIACRTAVCHDGYVRAGFEDCDDNNTDNNDACVSGCVNAVCGDGYRYIGFEDCDDANNDNSDDCVAGCRTYSCGDGFLHAATEDCDDANANPNDGCFACAISPAVYVVQLKDLFGLTQPCFDEEGDNYFTDCSLGEPWFVGLRWLDEGFFSPSAIAIDLNVGVSCLTEQVTTQINGEETGVFSFESSNGTALACACPPAEATLTWTPRVPSTYNVGGENTLMFSGLSCQGLSNNILGAYALVYVYP